MFLFGRDIFRFMDLCLCGVFSHFSSVSSVLGSLTASSAEQCAKIKERSCRQACSTMGLALGVRRSCRDFVLVICSFICVPRKHPDASCADSVFMWESDVHLNPEWLGLVLIELALNSASSTVALCQTLSHWVCQHISSMSCCSDQVACVEPKA